MVRKIYLIINLLCCSLFIFGQSELENVLLESQEADEAWQDPARCLMLTKNVIPKLKNHGLIDKYCYHLNTLSYCYNALEQYDSLLINNEYVFEEIKSLMEIDSKAFLTAQQNLALAYKLHGKFEKAKTLYLSVIDNESAEKDNNLTGTTYMNIGNLYASVEDFDLAIEYYINSERWLLKYFDEHVKNDSIVSFQKLASLYKKTADSYLAIDSVTRASVYYKQAFDLAANNSSINQYLKNSIVLGLIKSFLAIEDYRSAEEYLNLIMRINKKLSPSVSAFVNYYKGIIAFNRGDAEEALRLYLLAIDYVPENRIFQKVELMIELIEIDSDYLLKNRNLVDSLIAGLDENEMQILEPRYYSNLIIKGNLTCEETRKFISEKAQIIQDVVNGFSSNFSKINFLRNQSELIEREISYLLLLDEKSCLFRNEMIFKEIELSKGLLFDLEKLIYQSQESDFEMKSRRREIRLLEDEIGKSTAKKKVRSKLLVKKREFSKWYNSEILHKKMHRDYSLIYVQASLNENQEYISYFELDSIIVKFSITSDTIEVLEFNNLQNQLSAIVNSISDVRSNFNKFDFEKIDSLLSTNKREVVISRSGILNSFPFYLDTKFNLNGNVRFVLTLSQLFQEESSANILDVKYSQPKYLFRDNVKADKLDNSAFKVVIQDDWFDSNEYPNSILHFSGHSSSSTNNYNNAIIYLQDSTLSIRDLYDQRLSTPLLVLSSCEGGIGEVIVGEGVNSLNRCLSVIGGEAIISTLWKVNDNSTSQVIQHFYRNLILGQTKSQALANAKKTFLNNCPDYQKHPYYWAGIVLTGDNNRLTFNRPINWILVLSVSSVLLFGFLIFLFYKKKN